MDLVSIITPCYNSANYIEETINSVINQTYTHWEMLIVDDGSTDASVEIIKSYLIKDTRIQLFENTKNIGAAHTRNIGIKNAKGKFIAFVDADDMWYENKLEVQVEFMKKNDLSFTYTHYNELHLDNTIVSNKTFISQLSYKDMLKSNFIGCLTAMYNQDILGKIYMPLIRKRQDYGLWLRLLKITDKAYGINTPLSLYRISENSMSSNKMEMLKWNWNLFYKVEKIGFLNSIKSILMNIKYKLFS